jgi:hypothetical protein
MTAVSVFFVHVMKTGGTALIRQLDAAFPRGRRYPSATGSPFVEKTDIDSLLSLDPDSRSRNRLYSVHMPAWVGREVGPEHVQLTVLRDPVARTISHLRQVASYEGTADDLAEIYAQPVWRDRLRDFQTRLFSATAEHHAAEEKWLASKPPPDLTGGEQRVTFLAAMATGVRRPVVLEKEDLARAIDCLTKIDVVGTTDRLDLVARCLERDHGLKLGPIGRANESSKEHAVEDSLLNKIRDDNSFDLALYEAACRIVEDREH